MYATRRRHFVVACLVWAPVLGCESTTSPGDVEPVSRLGSNSDRAAVVRVMLEEGLLSGRLPDTGLLEDPHRVIVSRDGLDDVALPRLPGIDLIALNPVEIQAKADTQGDYLYLRFDSLVVGSREALAKLSLVWAVPAGSTRGYVSGGGFEMRLTKTTSGWTGEVISVWIS